MIGSRAVAMSSALLVSLAIGSSSGPHGAATHAPVLEWVSDVPLPGPALRFDYQCLDTTANRLYLSHMNAGTLVIIHLGTREVERTIEDLPRITGVWSVPTLGKVYASVPGRHEVAVIEARTLRVAARVGPIGFPDGIADAPRAKKVYVSDEAGGGELVIDESTDRVVTRIPLGGAAGNTVYDAGSGHILVAVQTRNEVAVIDPMSDRITSRHLLAGASRPHGMAVDPSRRLLFVANEGNATVLMVDLRTMRVVGHASVGEDPDVLAFDPGWRRLYVAAESGVVSVFTERSGGLVPEGRITMPHAHSVSVDPRSHLLYFPLQSVDGRPLLRIMTARRP